MNRLLAALVVAALAAPADARSLDRYLSAERARPVAPPIARERLPEAPELGAVSLSPDGKTVAFVRIAGDQRSLWLQPASPGASPRRVLARAGTASLDWSADSRWLFLTDATSVRALSTADSPGSGELATLGGPSKAELLAIDPALAAAVVVDRDEGRWRLWRMAPGRRPVLIATSIRQIVDAVLGRDGRVAFAKVVDGDGHLVLARRPGGEFESIADCGGMRRCDFIGLAPDGRSALFATDLGRDRRSLMRIDPSGRLTPMADDPDHVSDLNRVVLDRRSGAPLLAQFTSASPRFAAIDPMVRARLARVPLDGVLGIQVADRSWLIRREASDQQGRRYFLFDPGTGRARPLLDDSPRRLAPAALARSVPFTYAASDGFRVHGLLTVPPGRDLKRAPIMTLVHGGPWAHDVVGYNSLVQMLANRGMIVFQPQFRGSTGFGRAYLLDAKGDFGDGRVQRDIEDGTRWLLARGIGDPRRAAIMGASFGGYSTLQALSNGSDFYGAGIAIVPPSDFGWTINWAADRTDLGEAQGVRFGAVQRMLGMNRADPAVVKRLHEQSPRMRVAAMKTPLLLIAAGKDERVPIRTVIDYATALRANRAPVRMIVGTRMKHAQKDELGGKAALYLVEDHLARVWGLPAAPPPSAAVRRWMDSNMKAL